MIRCKLCPQTGRSQAWMYRHLYKKHREVQCTACSTRVKNARGLSRHLKLQHREEYEVLYNKSHPSNWPQNQEIQSPKKTTTEFTRYGERKWLVCPYCRSKRNTQAAIENEIRCHMRYKPFRCLYCKYPTSSTRHVQNHITNVHQGQPVKYLVEPTAKQEERLKNLLKRAVTMSQLFTKVNVTRNVIKKYKKKKAPSRSAAREYT